MPMLAIQPLSRNCDTQILPDCQGWGADLTFWEIGRLSNGLTNPLQPLGSWHFGEKHGQRSTQLSSTFV